MCEENESDPSKQFLLKNHPFLWKSREPTFTCFAEKETKAIKDKIDSAVKAETTTLTSSMGQSLSSQICKIYRNDLRVADLTIDSSHSATHESFLENVSHNYFYQLHTSCPIVQPLLSWKMIGPVSPNIAFLRQVLP